MNSNSKKAASLVTLGLATALVFLGIAYLFFDVRQVALSSIFIVLAGSLLGTVAVAYSQRA